MGNQQCPAQVSDASVKSWRDAPGARRDDRRGLIDETTTLTRRC
jgi:hypothetical protein